METPGRTFVLGGGYRYGFNGKEKDPTEFGALTHYDYGFRIYNPALGRFLSVDPLTKEFPFWNPYQFAGNTPIRATDLDGLEITVLPRWIPFPMEPIIMRPLPAIPRIAPLPPGEILLPPTAPTIPDEFTVGQPRNVQTSEIPEPLEIDWNNAPSAPDEVGAEWENITDPRNSSGSQDYKNKDTGEEIRFDPAKPGKPGWEGKDHWHRENPLSKGKNDRYLDKNGNPVLKGSNESHIPGTPRVILPEVIISPPNRNFFQRSWDNIKEFFKSKPEDNPYYT
jgi:RHS repeat-associated protein